MLQWLPLAIIFVMQPNDAEEHNVTSDSIQNLLMVLPSSQAPEHNWSFDVLGLCDTTAVTMKAEGLGDVLGVGDLEPNPPNKWGG